MPDLRTDAEANHLAVENDALVHSIVGRMSRTNPRVFDAIGDRDDAIQVGRLGMILACRVWDPEKGALSTIAYAYVRGYILQALAQGGAIRTPWPTLKAGKRPPHDVRSLDSIMAAAKSGRQTLEFVDRSQADPADLAADRDDIRWLRESIEDLPERNREVLAARMQGAGLKECGRRFGTSRESIRTHTVRAAKRLREKAARHKGGRSC